MDFEDMEKRIVEKQIHAAIFCTPHNPTGRVWEKWEVEKFMELCKKHDVMVVSDEIWSDIILAGHKHIPPQSVSDDARNRTVAVYAPSKTFNLAGLVGSYHIIYNKMIRERIMKESSLPHYNDMNVLSMHALIGAYKPEGYEWTDELCQTITGNIDWACDYIAKNFEGVKVSKPGGTYMLFVDCTEWCEKHGKTIEDVDALYEKVAALEPGMWMIAPDNLGMPELTPLDYVGGLETYAILDPENNTTVENFFDTEPFKKWCTYIHKWFENGWVNSGAASDTESYYSYIKSGQAFSFFSDYGHPLSVVDQQNNCGGVELTMVHLTEPLATTATSAVFCYSIGSGSEDPVKAMKMLNFLMSSTEAMNLLNWGIEGEDYVVNGEGLLDFPEGKDASTVGYHLGAGWILPNQFVCTPWATDGADIYQKIEDYNASSIISKTMGFTFDPSPVQDQISAVSNVRSKYYKALITGAVDPEEYIPLLLQEMEDAGSAEVIAEMQRQVDAWLAEQ